MTATSTARIVFTLALSLTALAPAAAAEEGARQILSCDPIHGVETLLLAPGSVLLFGEIHGTVEAPDLFADVVCAALAKGRTVHVVLEGHVEDQAALETYLASAGTETDRQALLAGPFWQRPYQDGRSSRAMLTLIEELHRLRQAGYEVGVSLLDERARAASSQERDRTMAGRLKAAVEAGPEELFVALTGNVHSRLAVGTPWNESYEPMGYLASHALPRHRFLALNLSSAGGTAWVCLGPEASDCGAREMKGRGEGESREISFGPELGNDGHHGTYFVGQITSSPPAVVAGEP